MSSVSSSEPSTPLDRLQFAASGDDFQAVVSDGTPKPAAGSKDDGPADSQAPEAKSESHSVKATPSAKHQTDAPMDSHDFVYQPDAPMGEASQMIKYAIDHYVPADDDDEGEPTTSFDDDDDKSSSSDDDDDDEPDFGDRMIGAGLTVRDLLNGDYSNLDLSDPFGHQGKPIGGSAALGDPMAYLSSMSAELS